MIAPALPVDLTSIEAFVTGEHHAMFSWLRENDPVYWQRTGAGGFWSITTYDDVVRAYREHSVLSSAHGIVLGGSYRNPVDTSSNMMLVSSDPPRHRFLRHVMRRAFAPAILARIARQVAELVDRALDTALADGGTDFAADVAPELPTGALMALVGIPHADARRLVELTHEMIGYRRIDESHSEDEERLRLAGIQADIFEYFADLLRERPHQDPQTLLGILSTGELNGRPLSEEEILYNCLNIAVGGNETSTHSSSDGLIALMDHPEQWELLRDDRAILPSALDEILRWASPNAYDHRVALRDIAFGDKVIHAGDSVALWTISANRDAQQFENPQNFDVMRHPNKHVSFGSGIHRCVGAVLGQLELSTLFGRILDRRVCFEPAGRYERLPSNFIVGVKHLPIRVTEQR